MSLLRLSKATLAFGARVLWRDVDLEVQPGEFIALIGANGSGKSMMLKTILGTQQLTSGEVAFDGGQSEIGYVPQHRSADAGLPLRVFDAVRFGLDGHKLGLPIGSGEIRTKVMQALREVEAEHLAQKRIGELSGGEMQRVRVAQAVISRPKLILADEPLSALDLNHQQRVADLIDSQRKALCSAVIFVTHDLNPVIDFVDRVVYLAQGRHSIGTSDEVMRSEVLSELYGAEIDVVRNQGRIVVLGAHDHEHHEDEEWV